ncbi:thiol reductant ABC exporter subunit CydC [Kocuria sp. JC486]|uniref:thiol reductant ABC exporter subunit CydC n=1 Tax=Kocuria sp. JC486 TaxID=1970736 RepID=UPI0014220AF8|nr:thiol reductant ABC exporter subunit CydC [Kocuria sp. JC486]NHU86228.1 thiol reductant ABC exporter subunit CydC [Kocuria sp. JC486]
MTPADRLGPGGIRALFVFAALASLKALALVMIAEATARGIVGAIAQDTTAVDHAVRLGLAGAVLRAGLIWVHHWYATRAAVVAKQRIRRDLAAAVVAHPRSGAGANATVATIGLDELDEYYRSVLPTAVAAATVPVLVGVRILAADWVSALVIALTIPLVPVFMILVGRHTRVEADRSSAVLQRLSDHLVELARGLPVLVGLGRLTEQSAALDRIGREHRSATLRTLRTAFLSSLVLELIATLSVAVLAVFIGVRLVNGSLPLATGLSVLILAPECFQPFRELGAAFHASQDGLAALRRARELTAERDTARAGRAVVGPGARTEVGMDAVTAGYPGREPVLHEFNARFPAGAVTAVTGASGTGKSTALAVLAGLVPPSSGTVTGMDPARVAWVPQVPRTVGATVREELVLYAGASDGGAGSEESARVEAVLGELQLAHRADADPAQLSPGELRRVAVARGLLRVRSGATVLLIDEPTAHLDAASAQAVLRAIQSVLEPAGRQPDVPDITVVVASHDRRVVDLATHRVSMGHDGGWREDLDTTCAAGSPENPVRLESSEGAVADRSVGAEAFAFLVSSPWRWAAAVVAGVAAAGFATALTALSGWLIVRASEQPSIMYLTVAIVGVRFFGIGRAVLHYAQQVAAHSAVFTSLVDLRSRMWSGLAQRGLSSRALATGASALEHLIVAADRVRDLMPRVMVPIGVGLGTSALVLIAYAVLVPAALPVVAVSLGLGLLVAPAVALVADRFAARAGVEATGRIVRAFVQTGTAADDLRPNNRQVQALRRLADLDEHAGALARRAAWAQGLGEALVVLSTVAAAVLVLQPASSAVASGSVNAPVVAVLALVPLGLTEPLAAVVTAVQQAPGLRAALRRTASVTAPAGSSVGTDSAGFNPSRGGPSTAEDSDDAVPRLVLDDLSARWPGTDRAAFGPVSTTVAPGRWLVVEGPSGSGKSTLLATVMGHLPPSSGAVSVTGVPEHSTPRVVWCPQEAHLFASTIRGNLALARSKDDAPTEGEMTEVLRRVGLGPFLDSLPQGLDTWVGSGGSELSGGQAQRVAVARALLARGQVILLDEPTAHLDAEAARNLLADLRDALSDRPVVLVTHHAQDVRPTDLRLRLG